MILIFSILIAQILKYGGIYRLLIEVMFIKFYKLKIATTIHLHPNQISTEGIPMVILAIKNGVNDEATPCSKICTPYSKICTTLFIQASQDSEITLATNTNRTTTSPSFHPGHTPHPLPSTSQDNNPPASRGGTWIDWYTFPERWSASGGELADMELLGTSLTASSAFGCMLVNQVATLDTVMIPEQLRVWMEDILTIDYNHKHAFIITHHLEF